MFNKNLYGFFKYCFDLVLFHYISDRKIYFFKISIIDNIIFVLFWKIKSFTNRFGLQSSRNIVSCSWCKASYHLKCFSHNQFKLECNFGEHNQLVVPPSWIVKSANKNVIYIYRDNLSSLNTQIDDKCCKIFYSIVV